MHIVLSRIVKTAGDEKNSGEEGFGRLASLDTFQTGHDIASELYKIAKRSSNLAGKALLNLGE